MRSPSFRSRCSGSSTLPGSAPLVKPSALNGQEKLEKLCSAITSGKSGVGDIIIFATHSKKKEKVEVGTDPEVVANNLESRESRNNIRREGHRRVCFYEPPNIITPEGESFYLPVRG